jgi:uncharacterized protein YjbI with pentapeptide repeats
MTEDANKRVMDHEELLRRYAAGDRLFPNALLVHPNLVGALLTGANLDGAHVIPGDLAGVNLDGASLVGAYLANVHMPGARLVGANLRGAALMDAHLRGANLAGADLARARPLGADLREANLCCAKLGWADLERADLSGAQLDGADLAGANLCGADLSRATLRRAILRGASLACDLTDAALEGADLQDADLSGANLHHADLAKATAAGARLGGTALLDVDLTSLCQADPPVRHLRPSTVDFRTILKSVRAPNLKDFLQRVGMPEVFAEYDVSCALSLENKVFAMLQSTFISYGSPDEEFARKLYEALHRNGVTTFFFAEHAVPGDKLHRMMRKGVNEHDRVILVCSRASLDRKGVLNEIEETLAREAREGGASYLIPIRLDDYIFAGWAPPSSDTAQSVRDRVVADFTGADVDAGKFDAGMRKLIAALKK